MKQCILQYSISDVVSNMQDLNSSFCLGSLKVAYPGENCNRTNITREAFEASAASMFNCPIVANYNAETQEIGGHDTALIEQDGESTWINCTEPVGVVPESTTYHWETLNDNGTMHDYFCIDNVVLWKRQPCFAKLQANGITSQSIEISILEGSIQDGIFQIDKFEFQAFCLLERDEPCFEQASLQVFAKDEFKEQWKSMMDEYKKCITSGEQIGGLTVNQNETPIQEELGTYSLTANQIREQLSAFFDAKSCWVEDFDDAEVYVMDWENRSLFGYKYSVDGDTVHVDLESKKRKKIVYVDCDEPELTTALMDIIDQIVEQQVIELNQTIKTLNESVTELSEYKRQHQEAERAEQEEQIFSAFDKKLKNVPEYNALKENASQYSVGELETQCYAMLGKLNFSKSNYSMTTRIPLESRDGEVNQPYGGLLKNKTTI